MKTTPMDTDLILHLKSLAFKYENEKFLVGDPSWFMHQVQGEHNKELLAFIASCLSYGSRKQFLPKIQFILDCSKGEVEEWLLSGQYKKDIPDTEKCFYRLYTYSTMHQMLCALQEMILQHGSIKDYIQDFHKESVEQSEQLLDLAGFDKLLKPEHLDILGQLVELDSQRQLNANEAIEAIIAFFSDRGIEGIIPKNTKSSCKRICMFLRWMVRDNSPVDLGLWSDIIDKRTLIMPMDTHVVQEANKLGLLKSTTTSMSTAIQLTDTLREIFPDDPLKGDFALFGVGVDETKSDE
jgi:uncharacterized protein (TIGR02757 family)